MDDDKLIGTPLHRDMDFIRELLLRIEKGERSFCVLTSDMADILGVEDSICASANDIARLEYHLELLEDANFAEFGQNSGGYWYAKRITWNGHEFLDTVRDVEVWATAKNAAKKVGGSSVAFVWELAKAEIKMKLGLP